MRWSWQLLHCLRGWGILWADGDEVTGDLRRTVTQRRSNCLHPTKQLLDENGSYDSLNFLARCCFKPKGRTLHSAQAMEMLISVPLGACSNRSGMVLFWFDVTLLRATCLRAFKSAGNQGSRANQTSLTTAEMHSLFVCDCTSVHPSPTYGTRMRNCYQKRIKEHISYGYKTAQNYLVLGGD